jgi:zinc transport system substrate-binding protein
MRLLPSLFAAALLAAGCGGGDQGTAAAEHVVAAFYPLAWAAGEIAGTEVEVTNLTPPGAEPHDLELSARDVERLREAELVLYAGSGFMPAVEDAVEGHANALDVLEELELLPAAGDGDDAKAPDPHVWLAPARFAAVAERVATALGRPRAGDALVARLEELDADYRAGLAECERRELVTAHAAFGYLADAYGLRQVALAGVSPESEPSPRALERLVAEVESTGATTVFFEPLLSPRVAETVARETGARTASLDPLEGLSREQLETGETYLTVMRANLAALQEALGCR